MDAPSTVPAFMSHARVERRATRELEEDARTWSDANGARDLRGAAIASAAFDELARRAIEARRAHRTLELPDEALEVLAWLFGESALRKALEALQGGRVRRVAAVGSGRAMYAVASSEGADGEKRSYLCFPSHYCSCRSFFWECVSRGEALACKHQLAARLASVLGAAQTTTVDDALLGNMMMKYFEGDAAM